MSEVNPELVQNIEEAKNRWLPGFANIVNKFFDSEHAATVATEPDDSSKSETCRVVGFQTNSFYCKLRTFKWNEVSRQVLGDRITLEWMQKPGTQDSQTDPLPRWGCIIVSYSMNDVSVLTEELSKATMEDQEDWNNGRSVLEIAEQKYPATFSKTSEMSVKDITKLLLEAKDGKVNQHTTNDMVEYLLERSDGFIKVPNTNLGVNIPVSPHQSINF